jgi:uncharacterized protein (TIGR03086 family)
MSDTSERYDRLAGDFAATIAAVPADRWSAPSPCEDWTARDVVRHIVDVHGIFERLVGRDTGDVPSVDDDPAAAFDHVRRIVAADLADPERATATYEGQLGKQTFEQSVDMFVCADLVIHRWDLGTAAGLDVRLPADEVRRARAAMGSMPEELMRQPGVFGPAVEPPPGADEQAELLAYLGRRAG